MVSEHPDAQHEQPTATDLSTEAPVKRPTHTVLGVTTQFTGTLRSRGSVQLEDIFVGDILVRGTVHIGKRASLDGQLFCEQAVIAGLVRGNVTAQAIKIIDTGKVTGDLRTVRLVTEEDARIMGTITLEETLDLDAAISAYTESHTIDG